jgi:protein transport protein SEC13
MIHDAQLDYYGKRLATCSSDRNIKVFAIEGEQQRHVADLKGHDGPVWQVCWAHPKFATGGSLLASCSYDHKVIIWKESPQGWSAVYSSDTLHDSSVNSIQWAPHEYGLILLAGSSDGCISIIQYVENNGWVSKKERAHDIGCNSVSWAPYAPPAAAMGGMPAQIPPARIASGGCDRTVKVWTVDDKHCITQVGNPLTDHEDWVRDVAWAPNVGLSHNILATGSQDHTVIFWTEVCEPGDITKVQYQKKAQVKFPAVVWRCSWSVTGSILAVSCGDNKVYLLKENADGSTWDIVSTVDDSA